MNRIQHLVVGVDFSPGSKIALDQAVRIAGWNHSRLSVLHGIEDLAISDAAWATRISPATLEREAVEEARTTLARWLQARQALTQSEIVVEVGPPLDAVLRLVHARAAELLILGVSGSSLIPMGAGTLAAKCLRKATSNVLLVHERQTGPFRNLVACVDFSVTAREVVEQARRVAGQDQSHIHFLHTYFPPWNRFGFTARTPEASVEYARDYVERRLEMLKAFVGDVRGLPASFHLEQASSHGQGIARFASGVNGDLIILGRRGQTKLEYVLVGSTVERLLTELPCSVLVVRPSADGDAAPGEAPGVQR